MGGRGASSEKRGKTGGGKVDTESKKLLQNSNNVISGIERLEEKQGWPIIRMHKLRDEMTSKGMTNKEFDNTMRYLINEMKVSAFLEDRAVVSEAEHKKNYYDGQDYWGTVTIGEL